MPTQWIVEKHTVDVYVGTDGDHQDEFMRGDRPKDLLRNSILTPSLASAIINGKYVNSMPLDRIEREFAMIDYYNGYGDTFSRITATFGRMWYSQDNGITVN